MRPCAREGEGGTAGGPRPLLSQLAFVLKQTPQFLQEVLMILKLPRSVVTSQLKDGSDSCCLGAKSSWGWGWRRGWGWPGGKAGEGPATD